ncbi:MAG: AAA family ATPase [Candidatus Micrarchaeota archaeon]
MRIIITGGPGTGKSEIARLLAKQLDYPLIDIKRIVNERGMFESRENTKIVDTSRLKRTLDSMLKTKEWYVLEGHLACEVKLPADYVFVLRTHPHVLADRLAKRRYPKKKREENLLAEMLDYCTQRVQNVYGIEPLELDTSERSAEGSMHELLKALRKKKKKLDVVDYSSELKDFLRLKR